MAQCPFCKKILSDEWVKHEGAALMGKASGQSKARSRAQAKAASRARWLPSSIEIRKLEAEIERLKGREKNSRDSQPKKKGHT
jgi:hypothetical protein